MLGRGELVGVQQAALHENLLDRERPPAFLDRVFDPGARRHSEIDQDASKRLPFLELRLDAQRFRQLLGGERAVRNEDVADRALGVADRWAAGGRGGRNAGRNR